MTIYVRDGGAWKPVTDLQVKDGGVWKPVRAGYVRDGGVWKRYHASVPATLWGAAPLSHGSMVFSDGGQTVTAGAGNNLTARANAMLSGKLYFEFGIAFTGADAWQVEVGVMSAAADVSGDFSIGGTATSWSYSATGFYQNNGGQHNAGFAAPSGSRVKCAMDIPVGHIWWGLVGVGWPQDRDPAAGTLPVFTNLSGTLRPACSVYGTGSVTLYARALDMLDAPPAGYSTIE